MQAFYEKQVHADGADNGEAKEQGCVFECGDEVGDIEGVDIEWGYEGEEGNAAAHLPKKGCMCFVIIAKAFHAEDIEGAQKCGDNANGDAKAIACVEGKDTAYAYNRHDAVGHFAP